VIIKILLGIIKSEIMKKLKRRIVTIADNLEKVTAKDLVRYSEVINRIQIKSSIRFVSLLNVVG
jgi:hypothetical protein